MVRSEAQKKKELKKVQKTTKKEQFDRTYSPSKGFAWPLLRMWCQKCCRPGIGQQSYGHLGQNSILWLHIQVLSKSSNLHLMALAPLHDPSIHFQKLQQIITLDHQFLNFVLRLNRAAASNLECGFLHCAYQGQCREEKLSHNQGASKPWVVAPVPSSSAPPPFLTFPLNQFWCTHPPAHKKMDPELVVYRGTSQRSLNCKLLHSHKERHQTKPIEEASSFHKTLSSKPIWSFFIQYECDQNPLKLLHSTRKCFEIFNPQECHQNPLKLSSYNQVCHQNPLKLFFMQPRLLLKKPPIIQQIVKAVRK